MSNSSAYKPLWVLFAVLVAVVAVSFVSRATRAEERIPWRTDLAAARAEAERAGKPVFAYFTASWCGPCQSLKHTTWADAKVDAALAGYVPVKIDIDEQPAVAQDFRVQAVPTMVVLPTAAGESTRVTTGALPPAEFLAWLNAKK